MLHVINNLWQITDGWCSLASIIRHMSYHSPYILYIPVKLITFSLPPLFSWDMPIVPLHLLVSLIINNLWQITHGWCSLTSIICHMSYHSPYIPYTPVGLITFSLPPLFSWDMPIFPLHLLVSLIFPWPRQVKQVLSIFPLNFLHPVYQYSNTIEARD